MAPITQQLIKKPRLYGSHNCLPFLPTYVLSQFYLFILNPSGSISIWLTWLNIWSRTIFSAPPPPPTPGEPQSTSEADFLTGERRATLAFRPRLVVVAVNLEGVHPNDDPDVVAAVDEGNFRYNVRRSKCS